MTGPVSAPLSPEDRRRLADLADLIVPRWNVMPSASDIGLTGNLLDRVLELRPDLIAPLRDGLRETGRLDPPDAVDALQKVNRIQFSALMQVIAGAYYLCDDVRAKLGYRILRREATDEHLK